jgi:acetyltransferase
MGNIVDMLNPQSVALIGATDREGSIGRTVLTNLLKKSDRVLYPVNPNREAAFDRPCFAGIGDVPASPSLAVIVTPAPTVPGLLRECGEAGVGGVIIISAGFGEAGPEGKRLEDEIVEIRKRYGMRIIGPNSLGVILPHVGLDTTFLTTEPEPGNIAFISQSGALGDAILDWGASMGIGFSLFASLGSLIDVGFGDLIDFLNEDYNTRSIMIYMERIRDARRFISAARGFALKKPIVVLKPGRFPQSARAMASHTGGRTGDDRVYDAVFKRVGLVRVTEVGDLFNVAQVLDSRYLPNGRRLAIITNAGGVGIIATDTLAELGGELAVLSDASARKLSAFIPQELSRDNPIDIIGDADVQLYVDSVEVCLADPGVDAVLVIYTPRATADAIDLARALIDLSRKNAKPLIAAWMGGPRATEARRLLLQASIPAYATPEAAVRTCLYMYRYHRNIELLYETPSEVGQGGPMLQNYLKAIVRNALKEKMFFLGTKHALDLLENYGVPAARTIVIGEARHIPKEVHGLELPLVLTLKNMKNGEARRIPLATEHDVSKACEAAGEGAGDETEILLQKAANPSSYTFSLQSKRDSDFRTVILLEPENGGSGKMAGRVSIGLPPLNQILARRLLEDTGVCRTLVNTEGGPLNLTRLEECLIGFANLIVDFAEIAKMEVTLSVEDGNVAATDATTVLSSEYVDASPYSHLVITPYPSRYTQMWRLPDGTDVLLRPIRPEDEPLGREMFASLSPETLRVRFFTVKEITRDILIRFCNIDYDREIAIVAEVEKDDKKMMIGGARLIREPDSGKAEFAILVHDDYQGMGLGAKLIDSIIGIAQDKGLEEVHGTVLNENEKMLGLCRKLGFAVSFDSAGVSKVSLPLRL